MKIRNERSISFWNYFEERTLQVLCNVADILMEYLEVLRWLFLYSFAWSSVGVFLRIYYFLTLPSTSRTSSQRRP